MTTNDRPTASHHFRRRLTLQPCGPAVPTMVSCKVILMITTVVVYALIVIFNTLSDLNITGLFYGRIGNSSIQYVAPYTPANWAFSIWPVIYIWQGLICIYIIATLFVVHKNVRWYLFPHVFSKGFLICYILNYICNLAWIFTFDAASQYIGLLPITSFLLFGTSFFLYLTIFIAYNDAWKAYLEGFYFEHHYAYVADIVIIHNGIMIYTTWTTVAQFLNCAVSLIYYSMVDPVVASIITLSFLLMVIVTYVMVDLIFLDKHTRYVVTPHLVLVWALTAALQKNSDMDRSITSFLGFLVALTVIALVVKVVFTVARHRCLGNKVLDCVDGENMPLRDE